ncbi:doublesex- and mab-3-related transcription factor B1-like [Scleropages formosus]|uniref:doublesex- and mab-3-related transcription factor B1-like n=1 Tax=Scleropages formosus TaxID=113540 RepID=UPI0010FAC607|nr:doublesex- and mab-3-related transcription factor B1-like [Scleropages formosus]
MPRFSKPENAPAEETVRKVQRKPKCSRCRNHGFVVTLKGHSGGCPFGLCRCWKCSLITQRTSIMASHRRMKKAHRLECRRASESREVRSRAGGGSGPDHAGGEAGPAVSSSSPVRTQSVTRMTPPQLEAPGGGGACSEVSGEGPEEPADSQCGRGDRCGTRCPRTRRVRRHRDRAGDPSVESGKPPLPCGLCVGRGLPEGALSGRANDRSCPSEATHLLP